jgi:hypothetical protein
MARSTSYRDESNAMFALALDPLSYHDESSVKLVLVLDPSSYLDEPRARPSLARDSLVIFIESYAESILA